MDAKQLKNKLLNKLGIEKIHPLHSLILDECCENALENDVPIETLIHAV